MGVAALDPAEPAVFFVDTSALAKRYVSEPGSIWLRDLLAPTPSNLVFIARVTVVEMIAALTRRERGGALAPADSATARMAFRADVATDYQVIEVTESLADQAMPLAERHGLRAYDAIQLAAALRVHAHQVALGRPAVILVSADAELNAAAAVEGLPVENPNSHP